MALETEHLKVPDAPPADLVREQAQREWTIVAIGLTAVVAVLALIVGFAALSQNATHTTVVRTVYKGGAPASASTAAPAIAPMNLTMAYRSDTEHGRRGPDGKWHDAASNANFTVKPGQTVNLTVYNYDSPHSFTAPGLGVDQVFPGGTASNPSVTHFSFKAPTTPGRYLWHCKVPCDPWAMVHPGYMEGYVTVKA